MSPFGPRAAPLGPPGISAIVSFVPSWRTRVSRGPNISTSTMLPSGMAIGPSGKRSPLVTSMSSDMSSSGSDVVGSWHAGTQ